MRSTHGESRRWGKSGLRSRDRETAGGDAEAAKGGDEGSQGCGDLCGSRSRCSALLGPKGDVEDQGERDRLFARGQPLTADLILDWAMEEAASTSRAQRRKWRVFRELQVEEQ